MANVLLFNMCMILDKDQSKVLVQDKVKINEKDWGGITFPGGHVDNGESLIDSVIREVYEETGLMVSQLIPAGIVHWENIEQDERWLIFLYKTTSFSGTLIQETIEGKVYWLDLNELTKQPLAPDMLTYLKLFFNEDLTEAYATWNSESHSTFVLK